MRLLVVTGFLDIGRTTLLLRLAEPVRDVGPEGLLLASSCDAP